MYTIIILLICLGLYIALYVYFRRTLNKVFEWAWDAFYNESNVYYHDFYWLLHEAIRVNAIDKDELIEFFRYASVENSFMELLKLLLENYNILRISYGNGETRFRMRKKREVNESG